jgi:phosphocarrier protein HPr
MSGPRLQRRVTITNPQGFHIRPMSAFAQLAQKYQSAVEVSNGTIRVNGKSQWDLMLLAAEQGVELIVEAEGPDAAEALDVLCEVLNAPYDESTLPEKG